MEALQFGFINARTLQDKFGVPAVIFGMVQVFLLGLIYRAIVKKEQAQQLEHDKAAAAHKVKLAAAA